MVIQTKSPSETIRIGKQIGWLLQRGDVVALMGELGAGKTQFIKGLAQGVGVGKSAYVSSPSFTLINEYKGEIPFIILTSTGWGGGKKPKSWVWKSIFMEMGSQRLNGQTEFLPCPPASFSGLISITPASRPDL